MSELLMERPTLLPTSKRSIRIEKPLFQAGSSRSLSLKSQRPALGFIFQALLVFSYGLNFISLFLIFMKGR